MCERKRAWRIFILFLMGAFPVSSDEAPIVIGSLASGETVILAEIAAKGIESVVKRPVQRRPDASRIRDLIMRVKNESLDLAPVYRSDLTSFKKAVAERELIISPPLGFDRRTVFVMDKERAKELGLADISDLEQYPEIKAGFEKDFLSAPGGLPGLLVHYDVGMANAVAMELSDRIEKLQTRDIDLIGVPATEPRLDQIDFVVLNDDKDYFSGNPAVYVTNRRFVTFYPLAWSSVLNLEGKLSPDLMIHLNALSQLKEKPPAEVADIFLGSSAWVKLVERKNDQTIEKAPAVDEESRYMKDTYWRRLLALTGEHAAMVLTGLFISIVIGFPLGYMAFASSRWNPFITAFLNIFQTIPAIALLCFVLPVLGDGLGAAMAFVVLVGLAPVIDGTFQMFSSRSDHDQRIEWSCGLSGIRKSAVLNVGSVALAAFIGAGGYGTLLVTGFALKDIPLLIRGAIPVAIMAMVVQWLFELAEEKIARRRKTD